MYSLRIAIKNANTWSTMTLKFRSNLPRVRLILTRASNKPIIKKAVIPAHIYSDLNVVDSSVSPMKSSVRIDTIHKIEINTLNANDALQSVSPYIFSLKRKLKFHWLNEKINWAKSRLVELYTLKSMQSQLHIIKWFSLILCRCSLNFIALEKITTALESAAKPR